jgi:hypothetical protein
VDLAKCSLKVRSKFWTSSNLPAETTSESSGKFRPGTDAEPKKQGRESLRAETPLRKKRAG